MQRVRFLVLIRRFVCPIQPVKGIAQVSVAGEFETKSACLPHHARADPGILLKLLAGAAVTDSNLKAREFAVFMPRVRGTRANIWSVRYRAVNPKNARLFTRGQFPASPANAAAHAFICSEMAGCFGRRFLSFKDAWP